MTDVPPTTELPEGTPLMTAEEMRQDQIHWYQQAVLERFRFHPATDVTGPMHDEVRLFFGNLAGFILEAVPEGRHQSLALTALQESMMWCNAAVALDTAPKREPSGY